MLVASHKFELAVIILTVTVVVGHSNEQNICKSPGVCVPMWACEHMRHLLKIRLLPPSIIKFVRRSHCGTFNDVYHVCCYQSPSVLERLLQSTTPSTTTTTISTVSNIRSGAIRSNTDIEYGMAILNSTDCGERNDNPFVFEEQTNLSVYPWMALLVFYNGTHKTIGCSGSLITDRYVLTAAHCIRTRGSKIVSVRLGEHDLTKATNCSDTGASPVQEIDIEEAIYNQGYNPHQFADDIGLLRLVSKAILRTGVQPICLPVTRALQEHALPVMRIAGWHLRDYGTCHGDSGAPLFFPAYYRRRMRYVQYGVLAGGSYRCGSKYPSLYTIVTHYLAWIASNLIP